MQPARAQSAVPRVEQQAAAMSSHRIIHRPSAHPPSHPSLAALSQQDDDDEAYADDWDDDAQPQQSEFEQQSPEAAAAAAARPAEAATRRYNGGNSNGHRNATAAAAPPPFVSSTLSGASSSSPLERYSDGMRTLQSTSQMQQQNDALSHAYATMHPPSSSSAAASSADPPTAAAAAGAHRDDFIAEHAAARSSKLASMNLQTHMSESLIARVARSAALSASKHTGSAVQETPLHSLQELDLSRLGAGQKIKSLSALDCVPRLTKLVLNHQLLESLHPGLQALHHLHILSVEHNQLTRLDGIWHLAHSLEELHLGHNCLERLPKRLGEMTRLIVLRLHANKLAEIGSTVAALSGCSNLTSLTLFANPLAELGSMRSQVLAALPALETLDAQGIDAEERAEARERFGGAKETGAAKEALLAAQQALSAVQRRNTELESALSASEKREQSLRRRLETTETDLVRSTSLAAKLDRELNERIHAVQELQAQLQQVQQQFEFYRIDHEGGGGSGGGNPSSTPNLLRSPSPASGSPQPAGSFLISPQNERRNAAEWNRTGSHPPSPSRTRFATPTASPSKLTLDFARGSPMSYPAPAPVVVLPVSEAIKTDRAEIQMLDLLLTAAGLSLDRRAQRVAAKRADARALQAQHAKVRAQMEAFNAGSADSAPAASPARRPSLLSSPVASSAAAAALDAECQELQHQIDALSAELSGLNSALQSAASSAERAEIQQARADVEESLTAAREELGTKQRQQQRSSQNNEDSSGLDRAAMGSTDDLDDLDSGSQSFRAASLSSQVAQLPELLLKLEAAEKALHADVASDSSRVIALNKRASTWSIRREYLTNHLAAQKVEWIKQREALAAPLPSDPAARSSLLESFSLEFDSQTLVDPDTLVSQTLVPQMLQLEESLCAAEGEVERAQGELEVAKTQMAATRKNGEASMRSPAGRGHTAAPGATALASGGYHFSPRIDSTGGLHLLEQNELLTALSSLQLDNTELRVALDKSVDSIESLKRNKKELKDALRALERSAQSTPNPAQSPHSQQDSEKLAKAERRIDSLLGELTALKGEYARSQEKITSLQQDLQSAQADLRKALQAPSASAPKSASGSTSPPNALAALQSMVEDYERDIPLLQSEKERLASELERSERQVQELQRDHARTVPLEEKERLVADLAASENRLRDLQAQRSTLASGEKDRLLAELAQSERRAEALQREKDALRDQLREAHRVAEAAAATAALAEENQAPQPPRTPSPPPSVRDTPSPSVQAQADSARVAELEAMFSAERRRALGELETMAAQLRAKETEAKRAEEAASRTREQQEAHEAILRQREALATQQQQLHEQQQRAYELAQAQLVKQQQELAAMEARQAQQLASQRELSAQQHSELQAQQLAQRDLLSEALRSLTARLAELQGREKEMQELLDSKAVEIADLEALLQEKQREMQRLDAASLAAKAAGDRAVAEAAQKVANLNADAAAATSARPSAPASAKASPPTSNPTSARSTKHAPNAGSVAAASKSAAATPASALSPALSVSSASPPSELQALALASDPTLHSLESEIAAQARLLHNLQDAVAQTQTELDTRRRIGAEIAAMEKALAESVEEEKQRARALLADETSELLSLRQSKFELDRGLDQSLADLSAITERHRALADQVTKLEALRTQAKEESKSRRAIEAAEKADRARAVEASRQELSDVRAQLSVVRADLEALEKARAAAEANLASLRDQTAAARSQLDTLAGAHVSARAQVDSESAALGSQVTDARRELNEVLGQLARALEQMAETSKDLSELSAQKRSQMALWDEREASWRALQLQREQERTDHEQLVLAMQANIKKHEEHLAALAREVQQRHQVLENVSQQQQQPQRRAAASNESGHAQGEAESSPQQFTFSGASNAKRSAGDASPSASPLNHTIPDALGAFASPTKSRSINMREQQAKYSKPAPLSPVGAKPKGGAGGSSALKGHREAFCATSAMEDGFVPPPAPVRNEEVHARAVEASAARAQARREAAAEEVAAKLASEAQEELNARRSKKRDPFSSTGVPPRGFAVTPGSPIRTEMQAKRSAEVAASRAEAGASFEQSVAARDALDAQVVQLQKQIRQLGGEKRALKSELRLFAEECAAARAFMAQELAADQSAIAESKAQVSRAKLYVADLMPLVDVGRSQALARLDARLENHDLSPEEREIQMHARIHANQPPLEDQPQRSGDLTSPAATPLDPRRAKATTEVDAVLLRTPSGRAATRSREAATQQRSHSIPASPSGSNGGGVGSGRSASLSPQPRNAASAASSPAAVSGSPYQQGQVDSIDVRQEREMVQDLRHEKTLLKRAVKDLHRELASALDSAQQEGLALQAHSTELRAACTESESRLEMLRTQIAAAEGAWRDVQDRVASMPGSRLPPTAAVSPTALVPSPRGNSSSRSVSAQKTTTTVKRVSSKYYLDSPSKTLPLSSPDGLKRKLHSPSRRDVEESKQNDEADGRDDSRPSGSSSAAAASTLTPLEISQLQQHNRELLRLHTELLGQLRVRGAVPRSSFTDLPSSLSAMISAAAPLPGADDSPASLMPKSAFLSLQDLFLMKEAHWSSTLASLREEILKRDQEQSALLRDLEGRLHRDESSVAARLERMEDQIRKLVEVVEREMQATAALPRLMAGGESSAFSSPMQTPQTQAQRQTTASAFSSPSQFARASSSSLTSALNSDLLALFTQLRALVSSLSQSMHGFEVQLTSLHLHRSNRSSLGEAPMINIDVSQALRERDGYILFLMENLRDQGRVSIAKLLPGLEPHSISSLQQQQQSSQSSQSSTAITHLNAAGKISLLEQVRREFKAEESKHPSSSAAFAQQQQLPPSQQQRNQTSAGGVPLLMSVSQSVSPAPSHHLPTASTVAHPSSSAPGAAAPLDLYAQIAAARSRPFAGLPPPASSPAAVVSKTLSFDDAASGESPPRRAAAPVEIQPADEFDGFAAATSASGDAASLRTAR